MARKITDSSPKFYGSKFYAIGALQSNSNAGDVPQRFSQSPVKPVHLSGNDLLNAGIRTVNDFLRSANCHFKVGTSVYFYEVVYGGEEPQYTHLYTGTPLARTLPATLSDAESLANSGEAGNIHIKNILPLQDYNSEIQKTLNKTNSERITSLEKMLDSKEKEFAKERKDFLDASKLQNDKILELNIEINTLKAEKEAFRIRLEERNELVDKLLDQKAEEPESQSGGGLADKISGLDAMLGDGASMMLLGKVAEGIGTGVGKLVEFGIDYFSKDKGTNQLNPVNNNYNPVPVAPVEQAVQPQPAGVSPQVVAPQPVTETEYLNQLIGVN